MINFVYFFVTANIFPEQIFVYKNNKTYERGDFVANILMQGDIHSSDAKLTGFIKTCENRAAIAQDCGYPMNFTIGDFTWPENSSAPQIIKFKEPKYGITKLEPSGGYFVQNGIVTICIQNNWLPSDGFYALLSSILMISSIIGLYLTILTHLLFVELRNLPGLNLLAMNTTMVLYQQLFIAGITNNHPNVCKTIAIALHFLILSTFFWTNVMAWDLYQVHGIWVYWISPQGAQARKEKPASKGRVSDSIKGLSLETILCMPQ